MPAAATSIACACRPAMVAALLADLRAQGRCRCLQARTSAATRTADRGLADGSDRRLHTAADRDHDGGPMAARRRAESDG